MSKTATDTHLHEIAIIGMACRFPGAKTVEQFWSNLRNGVESISFFSDGELRASGISETLLSDPDYVKASGILEDIELFDASFFGYSPREAEMMDPQQRFFLECAWEALERAGYDSNQYDGLIGVYAGVGKNYYLLNNLMQSPGVLESVSAIEISLTNDKDFVPLSASYKLNLKGPSINVQTACSTSLVAIHMASQSLLNGECDMALAGGVSITELKKEGYLYQEEGIYSSDGHCRAFDAKAEGMIGGNGVGIVVLKRLVNALEDGDQIHAVIKGSAMNNDGSTKVGFTAPSVDGQSHVIAEALAVSDVNPETVTFVETHGTATALGDPIEVAALTQAYRTGTEAKRFCALGAVKSNLGHTNAAAGAAGVIKTALALKNKEIPPTLHYEKPNPKIDFKNSPFFVNSELLQWKAGKTPRRAGVSSFGMGGTNAHMVLEEAPPAEQSGESRAHQLLLLSAKTKTALEKMTTNLAEDLKNRPGLNLADVAYTLQVGRAAFSHRRMLVCKNNGEVVKGFQPSKSKDVLMTFREPGDRPVAFMFPGQGAQHVNMGKGLYDSEPKFREVVDRCCELLKPHLEVEIRAILYPADADIESSKQKLKQTAITQPALFVIEYALAKLWMSWGVRPQAMIGHSIGEYVAACLAGVFSLEDALALVAERGRLMQSMPFGSMLAVSLRVSEVKSLLTAKLSIAAINAPELCVVSGPMKEIDQFEKQLAGKNVECHLLHTSHAFHSEMMDPILDPFVKQIAKCKLSPPKIPFISNLTGTWIRAEEASDTKYWAQHLRQAVRFADGAQELLKEPSRVLLEVGPGNTLSTLSNMSQFEQEKKQDKLSRPTIISSMRRPDGNESDIRLLLKSLGQLWFAGIDIDWYGFYEYEKRHRVQLPSYPFEQKRYWIEPKEQAPDATRGRKHPEKNPLISEWFYIPSWKRSTVPFFNPAKTEKRPWLVFSDEGVISVQLISRLVEFGHEVFIVNEGKKFSKIDERHYQVNPDTATDYARLLNELLELNKKPLTVTYLWSLKTNEKADSKEPFNSSFNSLLLFTRALAERDFTNLLQIDIISNGIQEVIGDEDLESGKMTILGPCRVIPQEFQNIKCRNIDLVLSLDEFQQLDTVEALIAELHSDKTDDVVAYRKRHRWIQSFEQAHLDKTESPAQLREGGVYLITGGLGGVGLVLARCLAETVKAKLILTGRTQLPAKEKWDKWLVENKKSEDSVFEKIRKVQELEALGAEVMVFSADVTNLKAMKEVVTQGTQKFGQIHGVIHSAGIAGGGLIELKTLEAAEAVFAPKVKGTLVLDALFQDKKLDFMILCSSLSSVLGGIGQIDYCGANAFMDAFAIQNSKKGRPITSVCWDTWQETGMAVTTDVPDQLKAQREESLKNGMSNKEGMEVFKRILQAGLPHVLVSTRDLQYRIDEETDHWKAADDLNGAEETSEGESAYARPGLSTEYAAPQTEIEKNVAEIWQKLFGIEPIGTRDDFFELGGHSLLATQLLNKLRKNYEKAELSLRSFFDNSTVAGVAQLIEKIDGNGKAEQNGLLKNFLGSDLSSRLRLIEHYLKEKIAYALKTDVKKISNKNNLQDIGLDSITTDLIWDLKRDFGLRVYPFEIMKRSSIKEMTKFVSDELERMNSLRDRKRTSGQLLFEDEQTLKKPTKRVLQKSVEKNKSMIFLLSAPRSGSTLFRLMLSGHSSLFCPPELGLLAFDKVKAWSDNQLSLFSKEGAVRHLMACTGLDYPECQRFLNGAPQKQTIQQIYGLIQEHAATRILVDKTPGYAMSLDTLGKAEEFFKEPKYIYLVRHPYPVLESFVRNRFEKLFVQEDIDPYWFAEKVWATCNRNILIFFEGIEPERCHKVNYESLVKEPEKVMRSVCEFLNFKFEDAVLHPYEKGEMIAGPGDPDILQHDRIDASLGESWKKIKLPLQLSDFSQNLAKNLNYELPQEDTALKTGTEGMDQRNAEELLANLDDLSDEGVNTLLNNLITDKGKKNV